MALNITYNDNYSIFGTGTETNPYVFSGSFNNSSYQGTGYSKIITFEATTDGTIHLSFNGQCVPAGIIINNVYTPYFKVSKNYGDYLYQSFLQDLNGDLTFDVIANDSISLRFDVPPGIYEYVQFSINSSIYLTSAAPPPQLPVSLFVINQPGVLTSGQLLSPQPSIGIQDSYGNSLVNYDTDVQASLIVVSGSATLTGTTTVSTTSGVATFSDLVITGNGLFYLQFDSTILAINSVNSNQLFFPPDAGNPNPPIPVKPKRSYIPGAVPAYTDLAVNEFAINVADRKGYIRDSNDIVHLLFDGYASGSGETGGTVYSVGISSTDFDVTNSPVTTSGFIGLDLATQSITAGTYGDGSNTVSITVNSKGIITGISENALATSNWDAAYGWGNHSLAGYLTTETDPVFSASTAAGITGTDTGNWNTAYGWGDHSKAGYLSSVTTTDVSEGTNLYFTDARARAAVSAGTGISYDNITGVITNSDPDQLVTLTAGTDISITGTYPSFTINYSGTAGSGTVTSVAVSVPTGLTITSGSPITISGTIAIGFDTGYSIPLTADQTNWNTAYGWGNHASAGYLTTETDPVFVASTAYGITTTDTGNWNSAYSERRQWDGGSTNLVAATGRTSLGATTVGANFFTLTNPSAITFPRINANNTISALDAATFRSAIGAGTSSTTGTVTSIVAGSYLTGGTITSTGTIAVDATSANTASKVVARDASGNFSAGTVTASLSGNATSATNIAGGGAGQIPYQSAAGSTAMLAAGSAGQILTSNGISAPTWGNVLPAGCIQMYGGVSAPTGWLVCDGSEVSRTIYASLFAAIGTNFGSGNGSTTFNLPSFNRRAPVGAGGTGTATLSNTIGSSGGAETHTLTVAEMPTHNHDGSTGSAGSHYHTFGRPALSYVSPNGTVTVSMPGGTMHKFSDGDGVNDTDTAANHSHTINNAGSGSSHNNFQPSLVVNFIIKT